MTEYTEAYVRDDFLPALEKVLETPEEPISELDARYTANPRSLESGYALRQFSGELSGRTLQAVSVSQSLATCEKT